MFTKISRRYVRCLLSVKYLVKKSPLASESYCTKSSDKNSININNEKSVNEILGSIASKYQVFRNEDSSVILDVNEQNLSEEPFDIDELDPYDEFAGLNLARGVAGVYEIEDLVEVLRRENAQNIFVASLPSELKYVDYICVVTGKSGRHMIAIAQFVRKLFKVKRNSKDILPKIEGENSREWIALDLGEKSTITDLKMGIKTIKYPGNIALHIFSTEARIKYDLDSLWSLGEEFDDECNKPDDPIVRLLQQHSVYLKDLHPADSNT